MTIRHLPEPRPQRMLVGCLFAATIFLSIVSFLAATLVAFLFGGAP